MISARLDGKKSATARASSRVPDAHAGKRPLRILFVGEACTYAHVARPAVLARWAREAGHEVHFACGSAYAEVARMEGLAPLLVPAVPTALLKARIAKGEFFFSADELGEYIRAEMELYERVRPDLVVGDFRLSLNTSATLAGIPLLALLNAHWSPWGRCALPAPDGGIFRYLPHGPRRVLMAGLRPFAFRCFAAPQLNRVRRRYGLPALPDFRQHYAAGTWCAYLDLPEFHALAGLPAGHFFLGPILWQPRGLTDVSLDPLNSRRDLVYVTLGGSGDGTALRQILSALLSLDCDIVLSGVEPDQARALKCALPALAGRMLSAALLNPEPVLRRARLTVCHGGSGSVYQSLAAGVPVLCVPGNPDQGLVSADAVRAGAGLVVELYRATQKRLGLAAAELLTHSRYTEAAWRISSALRFHNTRGRWLDFLDHAQLKNQDRRTREEKRMLSIGWRNLKRDRMRMAVAVCGVVFAVVLVTMEVGVLLGLARNASLLIDTARADLLVSTAGVKTFDFATPLEQRKRYRIEAVPGVERVEEYNVSFGAWKLPNGGIVNVQVVGLEDRGRLSAPLPLVSGQLEDLHNQDAVIIDEGDCGRLGGVKVGDWVEVLNRRAQVVGMTREMRSFSTMPYLFTSIKSAENYGMLTDSSGRTLSVYFLVRTKPGCDVDAVRQAIEARVPDVEAHTRAGLSWRTRKYWLLETGVGLGFIAAALMGVLVGGVIVSQTLYAMTLEKLPEFGVLKALGAGMQELTRIVLEQGLICGALGLALGLSISWGAGAAAVSAGTAVELPWTLVVLVILLTAGLCAAAALVSILRLRRLEPALVFKA